MRAGSGDCPVGRLRNVSAPNPSALPAAHVHTAPHLTRLADVILHTEDCDYNPTGGAGGKAALELRYRGVPSSPLSRAAAAP